MISGIWVLAGWRDLLIWSICVRPGMEPSNRGRVMSESKNRGTLLWVLGGTFVALAGVGFASWFKDHQKAESLVETRRQNCFNQVKQSFRYPSKAVLLGTADLSSTRISGRAEFMNGFGAMIPYRFECEFYSSSSDSVKGTPEVAEGG